MRETTEDTMLEQDLHFYLRLNADEFPYIAHESWLVSGAAYRGRYVDPASAVRRRVRLYHPQDERQTVILHADQLEPEVYPWASPAHSAAIVAT